jgi:PPOX class probable F420-dependent enzyme
MGLPLPVEAKAWLDGRSFPVVGSIDPDGRPQLSIVWAKRDGDDILFSTLRDRRKGRNLTRDPRVSVLVANPDEPYEYVEVRGTATVTDDPGGSLIKELGRHYNDGEEFVEPDQQSARRVIVRVTADHVTTYGLPTGKGGAGGPA